MDSTGHVHEFTILKQVSFEAWFEGWKGRRLSQTRLHYKRRTKQTKLDRKRWTITQPAHQPLSTLFPSPPLACWNCWRWLQQHHGFCPHVHPAQYKLKLNFWHFHTRFLNSLAMCQILCTDKSHNSSNTCLTKGTNIFTNWFTHAVIFLPLKGSTW